MTTATTGTGTITLGSAKAGYLSFAEAGIANSDTVNYVIVDGDNFEMGIGTYTSAGTTLSRDTVVVSKISGVSGTTKLTLSGSAEAFLSPGAADIAFVDVANTFTQTQSIVSTDAGSAAGPLFDLYRDSASPAANDILGKMTFYGRNSAASKLAYSSIQAELLNVTAGSENSYLVFNNNYSGTERTNLELYGNGYALAQSSVTNRPSWEFYNFTADATPPSIVFSKDRAGSIVQSGDDIGKIEFGPYDGASYLYGAASIIAEVDGTPGTTDMPMRLTFSVAPDGSATASNYLRVQNNGMLRSAQNAGANVGVVPAKYWTSLTADYALTNAATEQKLFNTTTNGALTLPTGVYEFECLLYITGMSGTSGNAAFDPIGAGTAVADRFGYATFGMDNTTPTTPAAMGGSVVVAQQSATNIVTAATGSAMWARVSGIFRVTTAGTIIPSITLTTASAATAKAGSWFKCAKIGETTENYVGAWT